MQINFGIRDKGNIQHFVSMALFSLYGQQFPTHKPIEKVPYMNIMFENKMTELHVEVAD